MASEYSREGGGVGAVNELRLPNCKGRVRISRDFSKQKSELSLSNKGMRMSYEEVAKLLISLDTERKHFTGQIIKHQKSKIK